MSSAARSTSLTSCSRRQPEDQGLSLSGDMTIMARRLNLSGGAVGWRVVARKIGRAGSTGCAEDVSRHLPCAQWPLILRMVFCSADRNPGRPFVRFSMRFSSGIAELAGGPNAARRPRA